MAYKCTNFDGKLKGQAILGVICTSIYNEDVTCSFVRNGASKALITLMKLN